MAQVSLAGKTGSAQNGRQNDSLPGADAHTSAHRGASGGVLALVSTGW